MESSKYTKMTVAQFLSKQIELCGKPQVQIAQEVGYPRPNIITMLKQGRTKVPLAKVGPLAESIGADPAYLLRLVLQEYMPETWASVEKVFMPALLTENERQIVNAFREATNNTDPRGAVTVEEGAISVSSTSPVPSC